MKKPRRLVHARALESNVINDQEENVMSKNITAAAKVIPFHFESHEVRSLLINDQPWFVAADVASALHYLTAKDMARNLDDDEKGRQIVPTLGGDQEMLVINESGLYSAILRSRKAEAKRFKRWVTAEVLPAIRKHGRYTDEGGQMGSLVGAVIGTSGVLVLDRVIEQKASPIPHDLRRSFKHTMKSRLRSRFNVQRADLIPAEKLDAACNFIAAYALEGEWLPKEAKSDRQLDIHYPEDFLDISGNGMRRPRNGETDYFDVALGDLSELSSSPCELILCKLGRAGYNVDAAWWEIRTYRNKVPKLLSMIRVLGDEAATPQQYVIKRGDGRVIAA